MIVAIVGLVSVMRAIFSGGGGEKKPTPVSVEQQNREALLSSSVDHRVRMTVRGPIVANEDFKSYRITVTSSSRSFVAYSGYLEKQLFRKDFDNNLPAYEEFVNALNKAALPNAVPFPAEEDSTLGVCATGKVHEFELLDDEGSVFRFWRSTCKGSPGSLYKGASVDQLSNLFTSQIPDVRDLMRQANVRN